jgi:hypothetical protein
MGDEEERTKQKLCHFGRPFVSDFLSLFSLHLRRVLLLLLVLLLLSSSPSSRQFLGPICPPRVGGASGLYGVSDDAERRSVVRVWKEGRKPPVLLPLATRLVVFRRLQRCCCE